MRLDKQEEVRKHFDSLYKQGILPWKDHPPEPALSYFLNYLKDKAPEGKVLDLGCGDGWISFKAARASFRVWGIDGSATAIKKARQAAQKQGLQTKVKFKTGNALNLAYPDSFFNGLIDRGLFHHILPENRQLYLQNILRVLKNNSFMYLAVFSQKNPEGIGQRFSRQKIRQLFEKHFKPVFFIADPYPSPAPAHLLHFILKRKTS